MKVASLQLSMLNAQLTMNYQFSMIKQVAASNCKLLNENLLKIENCKLKIVVPGSAS